jgi:hypothetical protein
VQNRVPMGSLHNSREKNLHPGFLPRFLFFNRLLGIPVHSGIR